MIGPCLIRCRKDDDDVDLSYCQLQRHVRLARLQSQPVCPWHFTYSVASTCQRIGLLILWLITNTRIFFTPFRLRNYVALITRMSLLAETRNNYAARVPTKKSCNQGWKCWAPCFINLKRYKLLLIAQLHKRMRMSFLSFFIKCPSVISAILIVMHRTIFSYTAYI